MSAVHPAVPIARLAAPALVVLAMAAALVHAVPHEGGSLGALVLVALAWGTGWFANQRLCALAVKGRHARTRDLAVASLFGLTLVALWEIICVGFTVPLVLMPAPSLVLQRFFGALPTLMEDFQQTVLREALPGWLLGSALGFAVAILCDRFDRLRQALLPIGDFVSALPIIGIAPIMVMWFGFDWHSKVAVVVVMTFFPMLVNAVAGLQAAGRLERDLMRSYGARYWRTLVALRLPAAMPFLFNALKINATLAMIGAIVAEFFGTPVVGMGFRISTEVGRMALDMVWATIVVAALAGSALYGLVSMAERVITFWHPSVRGGGH